METKTLAQLARLIAVYRQRSLAIRGASLLDGTPIDPDAAELLHYAAWVEADPLVVMDRGLSLGLLLKENGMQISRLREEAKHSADPRPLLDEALAYSEQMRAAVAFLEMSNGSA